MILNHEDGLTRKVFINKIIGALANTDRSWEQR